MLSGIVTDATAFENLYNTKRPLLLVLDNGKVRR
jgi:hypothetical protein